MLPISGEFEYVNVETSNEEKSRQRGRSRKKSKKKKPKHKKHPRPLVKVSKEPRNVKPIEDAIVRFSYLDFLTQRYHQTNQLLAKLTTEEVKISILMFYLFPERYAWIFGRIYSYEGKSNGPSIEKDIKTDVWNDGWEVKRYPGVVKDLDEFKNAWSEYINKCKISFDEVYNSKTSTRSIPDLQTMDKYDIIWARIKSLGTDNAIDHELTFILFSSLLISHTSNSALNERNGVHNAMGGIHWLSKRENVWVMEISRDKFIDSKYGITHNGIDEGDSVIHYDKFVYAESLVPIGIFEFSLYLALDYMSITKYGRHMTKRDIRNVYLGGKFPDATIEFTDEKIVDIPTFTRVSSDYSKGLLINRCINHIIRTLQKNPSIRLKYDDVQTE